jgi:hypothetical protein
MIKVDIESNSGYNAVDNHLMNRTQGIHKGAISKKFMKTKEFALPNINHEYNKK